MQKVRIITKRPNENKVYDSTTISVKFDEKVVLIWNGIYWEEIPFENVCVLSTWEE